MTAVALLLLAVLLPLAACTAGSAPEDGARADAAPDEVPEGSTAPPVAGDLVVFAAASLTDAMEALAAELEATHPELDVLLNLAGSQQLAGQLLEGAPADVLATADEPPMARVAGAGLLDGEAATFATNTLAIAVEPGNPLGIEGLADLERDGLVVVLAAPAVPAGALARRVLDEAGVALAPASLEPDVRAVLGRVALGEADAGIVYRSDIRAAGDRVDGVEIPEEANAVARPAVGVLADAPNPDAAAAFVALLRSERGADILGAHGFGPP